MLIDILGRRFYDDPTTCVILLVRRSFILHEVLLVNLRLLLMEQLHVNWRVLTPIHLLSILLRTATYLLLKLLLLLLLHNITLIGLVDLNVVLDVVQTERVRVGVLSKSICAFGPRFLPCRIASWHGRIAFVMGTLWRWQMQIFLGSNMNWRIAFGGYFQSSCRSHRLIIWIIGWLRQYLIYIELLQRNLTWHLLIFQILGGVFWWISRNKLLKRALIYQDFAWNCELVIVVCLLFVNEFFEVMWWK